MKRRNADCGKIRRPIKKNKIAEQIGSNTLLYVKFLLLWASVITADFLLEFRFEFLWPFWLLLRSVYDSFKYKGLAFSVLFVCIAITSDLVCLFFIPVQWLFFAASTYVWVQYVWHTDKGICLPTIILWILFVYLEAAIRWKDSRNIPHLDLCRPFAAHCIGYPVVTLGFGFKSYVGYCIRQRKQREVAKDNDFYMQLLQEALPKDESTLLDQVPGDGSSGAGSEQQLPKDLIVVTATTSSITTPSAVSMSSTLLNSMNTSSSSTSSSSRSDAGQNHHHHHPHNHHNHHHHNHQQQQQQQQQPNTHSKSAQNHKSPSNSTVSTSHVNGHVSSGSSPSVNTSAMNGGLNHQASSGQGSSKHRKSLDKDSSSTSSSASSTSNGSVKGSNGGAGGGGSGNFSYHQAIATFPQSNGGGGGCSTATASVATVTASSTKETSVSGAPQRGNDHGSNHVTSGPTVKDTKESPSAASVGQNRKDSDKESSGSSVTTPPTGIRSANGVANRSKSPADGPSPCTGKAVGKQVNGHVPNLEPSQVPPPNTAANGLNGESSPVTVPVTEAKSSRSGRKNRLKQQQKAADQANISTIAKIFATLGLASTVTTLTTATTSTASGGSSTTNSANFGGTTSTTATDCGAVPGFKDGREDGAGGVPSGHEGSPSARAAAGNTQQSTLDAGDAAQPKPPAGGPPVPPSPTVVMVQKACETCPRLEGDLKKVRAEVAAHRQAENELRQKYDTTATNLKGCLQAKQKDCDELQSRYQELSSQRQQERQSLQTVERRLGEERRLRQSLESQLGNERKHRKLAEERVSRGECSEACMAKKRQMQLELDKLKHELLSSEESKHLAEKQTRSFEQEMRKFEVQLRNRESQQNTDVLMSALAAMQDKNATLEKSLSAETRVKLDLFSALGGARREVDILTCSLRSKDSEILDLNAKIVELVAVMPTMPDDTLCLTGPVGSGTGQDGGPGASMMRLPDAPQLLPQPLSGGLNGVGGGAGSGGTGQQPSPMSHMVLNGGQPLIGQLGGGLGVLTSTMTTVSSSNSVCPPPGVTLASLASGAGSGAGSVGQLVQMQGTNQGNGNCPSGLDPNATVYTPKNNGMVGGTEA